MEKRGRPKKDEKKTDRVTIRLTAEEARMLDRLIDETGASKAEIFAHGLRIVYNLGRRK